MHFQFQFPISERLLLAAVIQIIVLKIILANFNCHIRILKTDARTFLPFLNATVVFFYRIRCWLD